MRSLILASALAFGAISTASAAPVVQAAPAPAPAPGYGAGTPGVGKTMVLAGPAARARVGRCGRFGCRRVAIRPVRAIAPATVARPAAGYAPPLH